MINRPRRAFARRHNIRLYHVNVLRRLIDQYAAQQTHAHNGDPYPNFPRMTDKDERSRHWHNLSKATADSLLGWATDLGFDGVNFDVGLYPTLMKGQDTDIEVPD